MNVLNLGQHPEWCMGVGSIMYYTREDNKDGVSWGEDAIVAKTNFVGSTWILYIEKPQDMKTLHLYITALTFEEISTRPAYIIFRKHDTPLPGEGPTWNNYSRYGTIFKEYFQWAKNDFTPHWMIIDCPDCKAIQIELYGPDQQPEDELWASFIVSGDESAPFEKQYWTT
jgi:hypothetical protein